MLGTIFPYGDLCPKCGSDWHSVKDETTGDILNILCRTCFTMPKKYAVDGRPFRNRKGNVGRLFRNERKELIYSFQEAKRILESIRHDWDKLGPERFDPSKHSRAGRESYKLAECARETILHKEAQGKRMDHMEIAFRLHINPLLGDIDIREITEDDVEKLQITLMGKVNPKDGEKYDWNTVRSYLRQLRTVMNRYWLKKHVIDHVPAFPDDWSENRDLDRRTLTEAEQKELVAAHPALYWELLETYAALGCRPEEVCGLKKMDLQPDGTINIQRVLNAHGKEVHYTKNRQKRNHPLPLDLHARLSVKEITPGAYLFTKEDGTPFNPNRLSTSFRWYADKAGYEDVDLYSFARHSVATETYRKAVKAGIAAAAERIGNTARIAEIHYIKAGRDNGRQ